MTGPFATGPTNGQGLAVLNDCMRLGGSTSPISLGVSVVNFRLRFWSVSGSLYGRPRSLPNVFTRHWELTGVGDRGRPSSGWRSSSKADDSIHRLYQLATHACHTKPANV